MHGQGKKPMENLKKTRLLITGINGLIGGILSQALQDSYDVVGLDRAGPFTDRVVQADIAQQQQVLDAFLKLGPLEYVIHLAADASVDGEWASILAANIMGTRNVYETARLASVRRIIFASSNHVTGAYEGFGEDLHLHSQSEPEKITIHDPLRPDSDYGVSKAFGEALARYYCARWGVESVCLRIGSVLSDDDPTRHVRHRKTWLSHRDLVQLVSKSLSSNVVFGIYYGVSNNKGAFWDLSNARAELGYQPQDDAATR
jgi:nucleoside-diphosphate-sugar epimerase